MKRADEAELPHLTSAQTDARHLIVLDAQEEGLRGAHSVAALCEGTVDQGASVDLCDSV